MKRITKLEISNFRAFFDSYEIELNKGENLLIYGENGSGKSSLFKSLNNFLSSSQNPAFNYVKHHNKNAAEGILSFTFNDYIPVTNTITSPYGEVISFGSNVVTTNTEQFIKTADLTKGFLDYKGLLAVYNHDEAQPNLFELIVEILLREFIPVGGTHPMGKRFIYLKNEIETAYTRVTRQYRNAITGISTYEIALRNVLKGVFLQLNSFLIKYFKLNLRVWFSLTPFAAPADNWKLIPTELKLEIKLNGIVIRHQSDFLNEARLSALAICLYLAVIKRNPQPIDFKVLFLDDVFIGLDLTNRLPILDIIKNEFSDYQVFISTYDRHLYELAKRKFETEVPGKWKSIELYVGKDQIDNQPVDRPILVVGESHFEKATQYLHDRRKPDYPAAANYFRKALEQIILEEVPAYEKADTENKIQILDYKLGPLIYKTKRFLERLNQSTETIDKIITLLPSLLHPLSHHEITSPVYRGELQVIESLIPKFLAELKELDIPNKVKCSLLESRTRLRIKYTIDNATGHFSFYYLRIVEPLLLSRNSIGNISISLTKCFTEGCYGENNGIEVPHSRKNFSDDQKSHPDNNFNSIWEAYDRIHSRIIQFPIIGNFPQDANYLDAIDFLDQQGVYQSLNNVIVW
jgi:energy-coupling factor transporter ATP-binding protein EcfA2